MMDGGDLRFGAIGAVANARRPIDFARAVMDDGEHALMCGEAAWAFGRELGMQGGELQALQWGAYLHDLGKIAIPDDILLKPGKLTSEEFDVIKKHTVYGYEMTRGIPFLPDATRALIRNHHERWRGDGYPDGLVGPAIPLMARMFSLVDVYDALLSQRPYKEAWTHAAAVAEMRSMVGAHFDPELAEVFLELVERAPLPS